MATILEMPGASMPVVPAPAAADPRMPRARRHAT